ncbi:MAG: hypothetical protein ABIA93_07900 [Candidatus Woesearchaeota archaeon]
MNLRTALIGTLTIATLAAAGAGCRQYPKLSDRPGTLGVEHVLIDADHNKTIEIEAIRSCVAGPAVSSNFKMELSPEGVAYVLKKNPNANLDNIEAYQTGLNINEERMNLDDSYNPLPLNIRIGLDRKGTEPDSLLGYFASITDRRGILRESADRVANYLATSANIETFTPSISNSYNLAGDSSRLGLERRGDLTGMGVTADSLKADASRFFGEVTQNGVDKFGKLYAAFRIDTPKFFKYPKAWDFDDRENAMSIDVSSESANHWTRLDRTANPWDVSTYESMDPAEATALATRYPGWDLHQKQWFAEEHVSPERAAWVRDIWTGGDLAPDYVVSINRLLNAGVPGSDIRKAIESKEEFKEILDKIFN